MCAGVPAAAGSAGESPRAGAELLANAGACISQVGRTLHDTAGHSNVFTQSTAGPAMVAAAIPVADLTRSFALTAECKRRQRQKVAEDFLVMRHDCAVR